MNALSTIVVILVAFTIGYKIISWLIDRLRGPQPTAESSSQDTVDPGPRDDGYSRTAVAHWAGGKREQPRTPAYEDPETRYAMVLGLPKNFTGPEIKERYRTLIASYHPDNVNHLGPELQEMANRKTREILEAYEYFRVKYNLR